MGLKPNVITKIVGSPNNRLHLNPVPIIFNTEVSRAFIHVDSSIKLHNINIENNENNYINIYLKVYISLLLIHF